MPSASRHTRFLALAVIATLCLGAFWVLLGTNYSPEAYWALPALPGTLEIVCTLAFTAATVLYAPFIRSATGQMPTVVQRRPRDDSRRVLHPGKTTTRTAPALPRPDPLLHRLRLDDRALVARPYGVEPGTKLAFPIRRVQLRFEPASLLPMAVVSAAIGLSVYYVIQQVHYFNNFQLGYADCGDYARTMFNTLYNPQELFLRVNPDRPLFYDHFQPGFLPFVPVWFLWPGLNVTILLQVLAVMACALPIYLHRPETSPGQNSALLLVATWLVFPPVSQFIYSGSYGFHCGNLCLPLYFLALTFWLKDRPGWALLFAVWAILLKEEAAIPIGTFGLYLALFGNRRKLGIAIATVAFSYFLIMTAVVIPAMGHQPYMAQSHFAPIGETKKEILLSPWNNPRRVLGESVLGIVLLFRRAPAGAAAVRALEETLGAPRRVTGLSLRLPGSYPQKHPLLVSAGAAPRAVLGAGIGVVPRHTGPTTGRSFRRDRLGNLAVRVFWQRLLE